jgi:hypothetical protein
MKYSGHSFSGLKEKTQRCLKCIDCFALCLETIYSSNSLQIFHQNIRGLSSKTDELVNPLKIDNINPHVLCFSERHMEEQDLLHLTLPGYMLGSSFCRPNLLGGGGGVCNFFFIKTCISAKLVFHITVKKRNWKICAVELETGSFKLVILNLYRVPTGDYNQFMKNLDHVLKTSI